jgi:tetratricopeptide (TPR) repeat protein
LNDRDYENAEKHLQLSLDAARKGGEDKWLLVASSLGLLGNVAFGRRDFPAAENLYRQSLKIHLEHQKPDESEVGSAYGNLGYALAAEHKNLEAIEHLGKAISILKKCDAEASDQIQEAKQGYRRAIARQSFMLAGMSSDIQQIKSACNDVLTYLDSIPDNEGKKNMRISCTGIQ